MATANVKGLNHSRILFQPLKYYHLDTPRPSPTHKSSSPNVNGNWHLLPIEDDSVGLLRRFGDISEVKHSYLWFNIERNSPDARFLLGQIQEVTKTDTCIRYVTGVGEAVSEQNKLKQKVSRWSSIVNVAKRE